MSTQTHKNLCIKGLFAVLLAVSLLFVPGCGALGPEYTVPAFTMTGGVAGQPLNGTFVIANAGKAAGASAISWTVYCSTNASFDAADIKVASGTVAAVAGGAVSDDIAFAGNWPSISGTYYIIAVITSDDDSDTTNNQGVSNAVTVTPEPVVDYSVPPFFVSGGVADSMLTGTFSIANNGSKAGGYAVSWATYLSINDTYETGDAPIDTGTISALGAGASSGDISFSGFWPSTPADYYILAVITADDDADDTNNLGAAAVTVTPEPVVDYVIIDTVFPAGGSPDSFYNGSFRITNQNSATGSEDINWTVYRSIDTSLEPGTDPPVDSGTQSALGGGAQSPVIIFSGRWPAGEDTYYLFITIDSADDADTSNNEASSSAIVTTSPPGIDYIIVNPSIPVTGAVSDSFTGSFQIQNAGGASGTFIVAWNSYLSGNDFYDLGDTPLGSGVEGPFTTGTISAEIEFSGSWPAEASTNYIIIQIEGSDDSDETNNEYVSPAIDVVEVTDYAITEELFPVSGSPEGPISGSFRITNTGTVDGSEDISWVIYRSFDAVFDASDISIASGDTVGGIDGGFASDPIPYTSTWPAEADNYYLIIQVTAEDDANADNDTVISPAIGIVDSGRIVIAGEDGKIMYSDDGAVTWTPAVVVPSTGYDDFRDVTTNGAGQWLACGLTQILYYSIDNAATWQPVTRDEVGYYSNELWAVAHHDGHWQVVGTNNGADSTTYYSNDGINFIHVDTDSGETLLGLTWDYFADRWYAVSGDKYQTSDDYGVTWNPDSTLFGLSIKDVIGRPDGDKRLVGVGDGSCAAYSIDGGGTWNLASSVPFTGKRLFGVAYNGNPDNNPIWVAVGYTDGVNDTVIFTSSDGGVNWFSADSYENTERTFEVAYDPVSDRFIAVGNDGMIQYSEDGGYSWTKSNDPAIPELAFFGIAVGP